MESVKNVMIVIIINIYIYVTLTIKRFAADEIIKYVELSILERNIYTYVRGEIQPRGGI